ncbi:hypothetical protein Cpir12675_003844 [Ceratocystis pirilliformis]|uniref:STB6-like N-terminal domain-containing protein n=1 Tax=Ceratocystis pirilliformis TaxID=259994 RepID=A0ABR3Z1X3_9PEZI
MAQRVTEAASVPQKRLVIPDPVALRYLGEDPLVHIVESRTTLEGYELYLVEQWACSRKSASTVIASYTGDAKSTIVVGVISVPEDQTFWSLRLKMFFREVQQHHARPRDTPLGDLITTNLSSFPSALTTILVPNGDIKSYQKMFIVNENLKRLGCSGRAGLTLDEPAPAAQAKFCSMYRVHEQINFLEAAIELVRLCQMALIVFGQLNTIFSDGLLCDMTEAAISNWWTDIGVEYYNMEPSDGILGPMTVSALLGLLMGARNRLNSYGAAVSKDAFEIESTMRGVSHFQKYQKMERTGVLDRETLLKLQSATAKAAANEGWAVQRAVKSTVAEIGGKRGELVMGIVSGRDKGGISEVETLDIEKFVGYAYGELPKWLWQGKTRRSTAESSHEKHTEIGSALMAAKEQQEILSMATQRASSIPVSEYADSNNGKEDLYGVPPQSTMSGTFLTSTISQDSPIDKGEKKTRFKSVTERMSDARSGLGRIKDAVGGSRRVAKSGRDDCSDVPSSPMAYHATGTNGPFKTSAWNKTPEFYAAHSHREKDLERMTSHMPIHIGAEATPDKALSAGFSESLPGDSSDAKDSKDPMFIATSLTGINDARDHWLAEDEPVNLCMQRLQRRYSFHSTQERPAYNDARWSRRASFSDAADAVLRWEEIVPMFDVFHTSAQEFSLFELARVFCSDAQKIKYDLEPWAQQQFAALGNVEERFIRENQEILALHNRVSDGYDNMALSSGEIMAKQRTAFTEEIKEIETLFARLDYEIQGLTGKVADVEEGVEVFERQVSRLEEKAEELRIQLETESWIHWLVRTVTGIGTGPNILQAVDQKTK